MMTPDLRKAMNNMAGIATEMNKFQPTPIGEEEAKLRLTAEDKMANLPGQLSELDKQNKQFNEDYVKNLNQVRFSYEEAMKSVQERIASDEKAFRYRYGDPAEVDQAMRDLKSNDPKVRASAQETLDRARSVQDDVFQGSPGRRIMAAIAVGMGAYASAMTKTPNYALGIINKGIDDHIAKQKERGKSAGERLANSLAQRGFLMSDEQRKTLAMNHDYSLVMGRVAQEANSLQQQAGAAVDAAQVCKWPRGPLSTNTLKMWPGPRLKRQGQRRKPRLKKASLT
jgi:hypothetical protein